MPTDADVDADTARALRYLLPSERLVAVERWHPIKLLRPAAVLLGVSVFVAWLSMHLRADSPLAGPLGALVIGALGYFSWHAFEWWNDRLVVSNRRMLLVSGLLTRRVAMMPLNKVTDMTFERSPLGRVLGYGTFVMESAGQDQALHRIEPLRNPERLYRQVSHEMFGEHEANVDNEAIQVGDDEDDIDDAVPAGDSGGSETDDPFGEPAPDDASGSEPKT